MVVQHNMQAANASRMLNITTSSQSKSTEKLSSGYRINRAADDAAGLSISEKMRRQIRGLSQASTNASDGVSAVQTAEGALNEVHSMLQRMNELAVQAANGTNCESDRQDIQNEITQLTQEIDRISQTTRFNESYLLKGNGEKSAHLINAHDAGLAGKLTEIEEGVTQFKLTDIPKDGDTITVAGQNYTVGKTLSNADYITRSTANGTPLNAGDSIVVKTPNGDTTYTVTTDISLEFLKDRYSATTPSANLEGDTIITTDGVIYQYHVDNTTSPTEGGWFKSSTYTNYAASRSDAVSLASIAQEGASFKENGGVVSRTMVAYLDAYTINDLQLKETEADYDENGAPRALTGGTTVENVLKYAHYVNGVQASSSDTGFGAGSIVITQGNKSYVTDTTFPAQNFDQVKEEIQSVQAGTTIVISNKFGNVTGGDTTTYTIVSDAAGDDPKNNRYTRTSLINLIKEGDQITINKPVSVTPADLPTVDNVKSAIDNMTTGQSVTIDGTTYTKTASGFEQQPATGEASVKTYVDFVDKADDTNASTIRISRGTPAVDFTYTWDATNNIWKVDDTTLTNFINNNSSAGTSITETNTYVNTGNGSWTQGGTAATTADIVTAIKATTTTKNVTIGTETLKYAVDTATMKTLIEAGDVVTGTDADATATKNTTLNPGKEIVPNNLTSTDIKNLVSIGSAVTIGTSKTVQDDPVTTSKYTVAGVTTADSAAKSVSEIYKMMAEELQKASNIGTDTDTAAKVVNHNDGTFTIYQGKCVYADPFQFNLHVGAEADMTNKIVVDVQALDAKSLGLQGITIADDTGMSATYAIDVIADALQKVSNQRAELGAVQNRLEHSIANLDNVVENTEASESRIRDTDMADEMVQYSKNNILAQAGQSMLAQANQATQGVLSLLQ